MKPNNMAFPLTFDLGNGITFYSTGMNIRTYIATAVMQGLLSDSGPHEEWVNFADYAKNAVKCADALIAQLAEEKL